jgi:hypothetical protein
MVEDELVYIADIINHNIDQYENNKESETRDAM